MHILIIDGEPVFREGLKAVLARAPDLRVVGEASSARVGLELLDRAPDVVLIGLSLPGMDGISAARAIKSRLAGVRVLVVSGSPNARDARDAFGAGADGYLSKTDEIERLFEALRMVARGERFLSPALNASGHRIVEAEGTGVEREDLLGVLSPRERDVFALIARGFSNLRIARELTLSPKTVDTHRQRIYAKLGCHSAADVVRFAAMNGLLRDPSQRIDGAAVPPPPTIVPTGGTDAN
jgi:DNA-binding NarL/FixJ family response regulator